MADHSIRIGIDSSEAKRGADDVAKSLASIRDAVAKVPGLTGRGIPISFDSSNVRTAVEEVRRSLRDLSGQSVPKISLGADASEALAETKRARDELERVVSEGKNKKVKIALDASDFDTETKHARDELNRVVSEGKSKKIPIEADSSKFDTETKRIRDEFGRFVSQGKNTKIPLGADGSEAETEIKRVRDELGRFISQGKSAKIPLGVDATGFDSAFQKIQRGLGSIGSGAGQARAAVGQLTSAFSKLESSVLSVQGILAGLGAGVVVRDIVQTGMAFQGLEKSLEVATNSAIQAKAEMARLREETDRLGLNTLETGKTYSSFLAAISGSNVKGEDAKNTFFAVAQALSVLGKSSADAQGAFLALEQIASKGKISMEELRQQLGERLPGTMNITAQAMGMSVSELEKALEKGQISVREFFSTFGEAVNSKFAVSGKVDSAAASFTRFTNAFNDAKNTIAQGGFLKAAADGAQELARFLNSVEGKKLADELGGALKSAVEGLITAFRWLADNVDTVKTVIGGLVALKLAGWITSVASAVGSLGMAFFGLAKIIKGHPLLALASLVFSGVSALLAMNQEVQKGTSANKAHARSLDEVNNLRGQLKDASKGEKSAIEDKIKAIKNEARESVKSIQDQIDKRKELLEYEQKINDRSSAGGQSTFGPATNLDDQYNISGLEEQLRKAQQIEQAIRSASQARSRTRAGTSGGAATAASSTSIEDPVLVEFRKQTEELDKQIKAQNELVDALKKGAEAAAAQRREMEIAPKIKDIDDNRNFTDDQKNQLKERTRTLASMAGNVKLGETELDLKENISGLQRLAQAHMRGVDAANAERIAQLARNDAVRAGVSDNDRAVQSLRELHAQQLQAAQDEAMNAQMATNERAFKAVDMRAEILKNATGEDRVRKLAELASKQDLANQGIDVERPGPTKAAAVAASSGQLAVKEDVQSRKENIDAMKAELDGIKNLTKASGGNAVEMARRAAEVKKVSELKARDGDVTSDLAKKEISLEGEIAAGNERLSQRAKAIQEAIKASQEMKEMAENIQAQQSLVAAYSQGAEAVEKQQHAIEILGQVQSLSTSLSKKQRAEMTNLIVAMADAKKASGFEASKFDLREQIQQARDMAQANMDGVDAVNALQDAQQGRNEAIQRGVVGDTTAVQDLIHLYKDLRAAKQDERLSAEVLDNRQLIDALGKETDAMKLNGEARVRRLAELAEEQRLVSSKTDMNDPRAKGLVTSAGDRAVSAFGRSNQQYIDDQEAQIGSINRQIDAMSLLGEERIRRMAEIEEETRLIRENGSATDANSLTKIANAGQIAVLNAKLQQQDTELRRLATSIPNMSVAFDQAATGGLMHFEDALVDIVTGAKSAREAFAGMAKSIAADLARMAIRMAIIQPLAMMFGGGFGGAAVAGSAANPIMWGPMAAGFHTGGVAGKETPMMLPLPAFHTGGVAGSELPMTRSLSSAMPAMSSWPKFHTGGLAGNEMPAVVKKGEGIFTQEQMAALSPVNNNTDNRGDNVFNINVSVPSSGSTGGDPGAAERQGRIIAKQIQQAMDEHLVKATRNGGILNPSGY